MSAGYRKAVLIGLLTVGWILIVLTVTPLALDHHEAPFPQAPVQQANLHYVLLPHFSPAQSQLPVRVADGGKVGKAPGPFALPRTSPALP